MSRSGAPTDADQRAIPDGVTPRSLAGFGRRLIARLVDSVVLVYGLTLIFMVVAIVGRGCPVLGCDTRSEALSFAAALALFAIYEVVATSTAGRTLGKAALGIEVAAEGDAPPAVGRATVRFLVAAATLFVWPLGLVSLVSAVRHPRKQTWHDRAARTVVLRRPRVPHERRWRRRAVLAAALATALALGGFLSSLAVPDRLFDVRFENGLDPFEIGERADARFEHVAGTYRLTTTAPAGSIMTSVGEFDREVSAVGIRVEILEAPEPGTSVGAMCLGPSREGGQFLAGYGFFVDPGGTFIIGRQDPDGGLEYLQRGFDERLAGVRRVSIECLAVGDDDVTLIGYADGLEIARAEHRDGYREYTYAGLAVTGAGRQQVVVDFTRVWAHVPGEGWTP